MKRRRTGLFEGLLMRAAALFAIALILGGIAGVTVDQVYRAYLTARAETLAQALDVAKVAALRSSITEETGPTYNEIRGKLAAIREVNSDARFVYLMGRDANGVYFLADSEPESSQDHSSNGEQYQDATAQLTAMFDGHDSLIEGPLSDDWGAWLSALAPVIDPSSRQVVAVIGLDIPAGQYLTLVAVVASLPVLVVAVLVGFLAINNTVRRRKLEALEFRSELVSIASHELRTPLVGIRWAAETLRGGSLDKPQKVLINSIHDSASHLEESIEDILQLASLENSAHMKVELNNVTRLLSEVFETQKLPAEQRGVQLLFDDHWPENLKIAYDSVRMRRVFNNIISNAIKYSRPDSEITVAYHFKDGRHCLSIADQGIGIPEKEQERIFSGFYRASNAIKAEINGTGMGLYLSRSIVEQHGGSLWVDSVENQGTTVYIALP